MDSSAQTTRGMLLDFFSQTLKMAPFDHFKNIATKKCFPVFLSELRALFELNSMWKRYARRGNSDAHYQRKFSNLSTFFEKMRTRTKLSLVCASTISSSSIELTRISLTSLRDNTYFGSSTRFGYATKIHNSVIWLNWVMFMSKIIIPLIPKYAP